MENNGNSLSLYWISWGGLKSLIRGQPNKRVCRGELVPKVAIEAFQESITYVLKNPRYLVLGIGERRGNK